MISSELISLIMNRYAIGGLAVIIGLIVAYFKGSKAAKEAAAFELSELERARQSRLRAAEAKNAHFEKQGEQKNEVINAADSILKLIGLFGEIQSGKGSDSDASKDGK